MFINCFIKIYFVLNCFSNEKYLIKSFNIDFNVYLNILDVSKIEKFIIIILKKFIGNSIVSLRYLNFKAWNFENKKYNI